MSFGIFVVFSVASVFFSLRLQNVGTQLLSEHVQLQRLQDVIDQQAEVIRRFNNTITNADVLQRVDSLEEELETTEDRMNERVEELESETHELLNETIEEMDRDIA